MRLEDMKKAILEKFDGYEKEPVIQIKSLKPEHVWKVSLIYAIAEELGLLGEFEDAMARNPFRKEEKHFLEVFSKATKLKEDVAWRRIEDIMKGNIVVLFPYLFNVGYVINGNDDYIGSLPKDDIDDFLEWLKSEPVLPKGKKVYVKGQSK